MGLLVVAPDYIGDLVKMRLHEEFVSQIQQFKKCPYVGGGNDKKANTILGITQKQGRHYLENTPCFLSL